MNHYKIKIQSPEESEPETFEHDLSPKSAALILADYHNAGYMILSVEVTPIEANII